MILNVVSLAALIAVINGAGHKHYSISTVIKHDESKPFNPSHKIEETYGHKEYNLVSGNNEHASSSQSIVYHHADQGHENENHGISNESGSGSGSKDHGYSSQNIVFHKSGDSDLNKANNNEHSYHQIGLQKDSYSGHESQGHSTSSQSVKIHHDHHHEKIHVPSKDIYYQSSNAYDSNSYDKSNGHASSSQNVQIHHDNGQKEDHYVQNYDYSYPQNTVVQQSHTQEKSEGQATIHHDNNHKIDHHGSHSEAYYHEPTFAQKSNIQESQNHATSSQNIQIHHKNNDNQDHHSYRETYQPSEYQSESYKGSGHGVSIQNGAYQAPENKVSYQGSSLQENDSHLKSEGHAYSSQKIVLHAGHNEGQHASQQENSHHYSSSAQYSNGDGASSQSISSSDYIIPQYKISSHLSTPLHEVHSSHHTTLSNNQVQHTPHYEISYQQSTPILEIHSENQKNIQKDQNVHYQQFISREPAPVREVQNEKTVSLVGKAEQNIQYHYQPIQIATGSKVQLTSSQDINNQNSKGHDYSQQFSQYASSHHQVTPVTVAKELYKYSYHPTQVAQSNSKSLEVSSENIADQNSRGGYDLQGSQYESSYHQAASLQHIHSDSKAHHEQYENYYAYPKYEFSYAVKDPHTGDHKSQQETRDGDVVKGVYSLQEPDGTIRTVEYTSDKHSGFNALVKRTGESHHIEHQHHKDN